MNIRLFALFASLAVGSAACATATDSGDSTDLEESAAAELDEATQPATAEALRRFTNETSRSAFVAKLGSGPRRCFVFQDQESVPCTVRTVAAHSGIVTDFDSIAFDVAYEASIPPLPAFRRIPANQFVRVDSQPVRCSGSSRIQCSW